jgi:hypothetical protein
MSKAEERAQAVYPAWRNGLDDEFNLSSAYCGFIEGYHQAEKDLELSWEDVSRIRQIMFDYNKQIRNEMTIPNDKEYCEELLKRFKAQKGEKV